MRKPTICADCQFYDCTNISYNCTAKVLRSWVTGRWYINRAYEINDNGKCKYFKKK